MYEQSLTPAGAYIAEQTNPDYSRDQVRITFPGGVEYLDTGTVLGMVTGSDAIAEVDVPAEIVAGEDNVGNGALAVTAFADDAGPLSVTFTTATAFNVNDAYGTLLGTGAVADNATAYGGITINLTAGATAFAAGDTFSVEIPRQDEGDYVVERGTYKPLTIGANDGTQIAAAILHAPVFADENGRGVVTARDTAVKLQSLQWPDGITHAQRNTALGQLAAKGIISRTTSIPVAGY
jgi:hypothetical protein